MACGPCQAMRKQMMQQASSGNVLGATQTAIQGVRFMASKLTTTQPKSNPTPSDQTPYVRKI